MIPSTTFNTNYLGAIFNKIKDLKSPIQLVGFMLAIILTIFTINSSNIEGLLKIIVIFMPFIFITIIFNKNILKRAEKGNWFLKGIILILVLIIALIFAFIAYTLFNTSGQSLKDARVNILTSGNITEKVNNIQIRNYKIQSKIQNYKTISDLYFSSLGNKISTNSLPLTFSTKQEMNNIRDEISDLRKGNAVMVFGNDTISSIVTKLQESLLMLNFSEHVINIIYSSLAIKGKTYKIQDIIETDTLKLNRDQQYSLEKTEFSRLEKDLIQEIGANILLKKLNNLSESDVTKFKLALTKIGINNSQSEKINSKELLEKFNFELGKYFDKNTLNKNFLELGNNRLQQLIVYQALNNIGLINLKKVIIKYTDNTDHKALIKDFLTAELDLFNIKDLKVLKKWIKKGPKITNTDRILSNIIKKIENKLNSSGVQNILQSKSVDEYVFNSITYSFEKNIQNKIVQMLLNDKLTVGLELLDPQYEDVLNLFKDLNYFVHIDLKLLLPDEIQTISTLLLGDRKLYSGIEKDFEELLELYKIKESSILSNLI